VLVIGRGQPTAGGRCGAFSVVTGNSRVRLWEAGGAGVDESEVEVSGSVCGIEGPVGDE
jgi:hypothetical protein